MFSSVLVIVVLMVWRSFLSGMGGRCLSGMGERCLTGRRFLLSCIHVTTIKCQTFIFYRAPSCFPASVCVCGCVCLLPLSVVVLLTSRNVLSSRRQRSFSSRSLRRPSNNFMVSAGWNRVLVRTRLILKARFERCGIERV